MGSTSREPADHVGSESVRWNGRAATRLSNGVVELIGLTSGGHLAEFRFLEQDGRMSPNAFWKAPWDTFDPEETDEEDLPATYGPVGVRSFFPVLPGIACVWITSVDPRPSRLQMASACMGKRPMQPGI